MKVVCALKTGKLNAPEHQLRGRVGVLELPEPKTGPEDVKIKVEFCAVCGSDPHLVEGIFGWKTPFGLGHEMSGTVVGLGGKAVINGLKVGDRVAGNFLHFCGACYYCRGGQEQFCERAANAPCMAEYVVWHQSQVFKLPDSVTMEEGCLLEPVSIAVRIVDKACIKAGQRVAISGAGPIGLLALQLVKRCGGTSVTVLEPLSSRRELAKYMGADFAIDPSEAEAALNEITGGLGYDVVLEASGAPRAAVSACALAARGGKVLYIAMYPRDFELPVNLYDVFYSREITMTGTYVAPYAFPRAVQLLPELQLGVFTQKVFPIEQAEEAFEAHMSGKYPKVLIKCSK